MNSSQNKPNLLFVAYFLTASRAKALAMTISLFAVVTGLPSTGSGSTTLTFDGLAAAEGAAIPSMNGLSFENIIYVRPGNPRSARAP